MCIVFNMPNFLQLVKDNDWALISDEDEIIKLCQEVISENDKLVLQYKAGKTKLFKALLGILSNKAKQKVNMAIGERILKKLLS